jgi:hypothetical protein
MNARTGAVALVALGGLIALYSFMPVPAPASRAGTLRESEVVPEPAALAAAKPQTPPVSFKPANAKGAVPVPAPGSAPSAAALERRADDEEAEAMRAGAGSPEQKAMRSTYVTEQPDERWTASAIEEIKRIAEPLHGPVYVQDPSCRETVCRMFLRFGDQVDAQAFIAAQRDPAQRYAFHSLDPSFDGAGFDGSDYTYELLIRRERPADLPRRAPSAVEDEGTAARANSAATPAPAKEPGPGEVVVLRESGQ